MGMEEIKSSMNVCNDGGKMELLSQVGTEKRDKTNQDQNKAGKVLMKNWSRRTNIETQETEAVIDRARDAEK